MRRGLLRSMAGDVDFLTDLAAYYKFDNNVLDYTGVNNGTATGVTFTTGQVDDCAVFNGTTGSINVADNDSLSFTDGTNDTPFTIVFGLYLATFINVVEHIYTKLNEYDFRRATSDTLQFFLYNNGATSSFLRIDVLSGFLSLDTWYHLVITYDGSGTESGFNVKINNTAVSVVKINNSYVKMINTANIARFSSRPNAGAALRLSGRLDDFAIYKGREFNNAEITAAYNLWTSGLPLIT